MWINPTNTRLFTSDAPFSERYFALCVRLIRPQKTHEAK
nr:MAG TPA: hypothetical protein [Caudoviricetes sp.]